MANCANGGDNIIDLPAYRVDALAHRLRFPETLLRGGSAFLFQGPHQVGIKTGDLSESLVDRSAQTLSSERAIDGHAVPALVVLCAGTNEAVSLAMAAVYKQAATHPAVDMLAWPACPLLRDIGSRIASVREMATVLGVALVEQTNDTIVSVRGDEC